LDDFWIGYAPHRVVLAVPPGMKCRLEVNSLDGGVIQTETDDPSDLVLIDTALDRRNQDHRATNFRKSVERPHLLRKDVGFTPDDPVGLAIKTVELEIDIRADFRQFRQKPLVVRDSLPVSVQHHVGNAALLGSPHHRDDLWMNRGLAPGELHDLWIAFSRHQVIQNVFDFFERQAESRSGFGEAQGAAHVAVAVDLDDAQTGVLLMVWTEPTIVWASVVNLC